MNMIKKLRNTFLVFACMLLIGCASARYSTISDPSSADLPETDDLLRPLKGYIIADDVRCGFSAIELPSSQKFILNRKPRKDMGNSEALDGPDHQGRIAYITRAYDQAYDQYIFSLWFMDISTRDETEIFTRQRSFKGNVGESISESSLSDSGGFVAFVAFKRNESISTPDKPVWSSYLEIIDTGKGNKIESDIKPFDLGDWFPDGRRLVYVARVPIDRIDGAIAATFEDGFGSSMVYQNETSVVMQLNLSDMSTKQLHIGKYPVVSKDGSSILIQDGTGRIRLYDVSSGNSTPVTVPIGENCHVFSFIGKDMLLYKTIPMKGRKHRMTSMLGRTPIWTLRVAQINTKRYKTVIQDLDRLTSVSYGEVKK